jgi:uncharacterized protein
VALTYLDASALVKILLREPESDVARLIWVTSARRSTSSIAYVEVRAALAAAARNARLSADALAGRRAELRRRWRQVSPVAPSDEVIRLAGNLAESTGLRALDAIHLASARLVGDPQTVFVTWDRRLAAAASALGMAVAPAHVLAP